MRSFIPVHWILRFFVTNRTRFDVVLKFYANTFNDIKVMAFQTLGNLYGFIGGSQVGELLT